MTGGQREYKVWRDDLNCRHFRIKGSTDDLLLESWTWCHDALDLQAGHYGWVLIRRYDVKNKKHRRGYYSPDHPLVQALGLVHPSMRDREPAQTENNRKEEVCQTNRNLQG
jgi:hypothetical protein